MTNIECYHYVDGERVSGIHRRIWGVVIGINGNVTGLRGNVSGLWGAVSDIRGDVSGISGRIDDEVITSRTQVCPQEGSFVAWKKLGGGCIAKLQIQEDAFRVTYCKSRKCRASKALVLSIVDNNGMEVEKMHGLYDEKFVYTVNQVAIPDCFDGDIRKECTHGIHFFITRKEAERWNG